MTAPATTPSPTQILARGQGNNGGLSWRSTPVLATAAYGLVVAVLLFLAIDAVGGVLSRQAAVADARARLERLTGRRPPLPQPQDGPQWSGSPFLEGPTITVAGAALMERMAGAVAHFGGRLTSSLVELQEGPLGPGFVGVSATMEMAQPDVQKLLYDLEAGMPFLFITQLSIHSPAATRDGAGGNGMLQVSLTLYGRWQGAS